MHVRCINKEHSSGGIKSRAGIARVYVCKKERGGEKREEKRAEDGKKERKKERRKEGRKEGKIERGKGERGAKNRKEVKKERRDKDAVGPRVEHPWTDGAATHSVTSPVAFEFASGRAPPSSQYAPRINGCPPS